MRIPTMVKTSSLVGVLVSWAVKMREWGFSGDPECAFLPAEWLPSAPR